MYKDVCRVIHTSGPSGTVGLFVYGPSDWVAATAIDLKVADVGFNPFARARLAFIGAADGHYASVTSVRNTPRILFKVMTLSVNSPL